MIDNNISAIPGTRGLMGNPMDVFATLGPDVQGWIMWIVGFAAFVFLVITIISILGHGAGSSMSSLQRDSVGKSNHWVEMVSAGITVIMVIVLLGLVFAIYF